MTAAGLSQAGRGLGRSRECADVAFRTYHDPGRLPERVGIDEPYARGYLGAMLEPRLPRRARASDSAEAKPVDDRASA